MPENAKVWKDVLTAGLFNDGPNRGRVLSPEHVEQVERNVRRFLKAGRAIPLLLRDGTEAGQVTDVARDADGALWLEFDVTPEAAAKVTGRYAFPRLIRDESGRDREPTREQQRRLDTVYVAPDPRLYGAPDVPDRGLVIESVALVFEPPQPQYAFSPTATRPPDRRPTRAATATQAHR